MEPDQHQTQRLHSQDVSRVSTSYMRIVTSATDGSTRRLTVAERRAICEFQSGRSTERVKKVHDHLYVVDSTGRLALVVVRENPLLTMSVETAKTGLALAAERYFANVGKALARGTSSEAITVPVTHTIPRKEHVTIPVSHTIPPKEHVTEVATDPPTTTQLSTTSTAATPLAAAPPPPPPPPPPPGPPSGLQRGVDPEALAVIQSLRVIFGATTTGCTVPNNQERPAVQAVLDNVVAFTHHGVPVKLNTAQALVQIYTAALELKVSASGCCTAEQILENVGQVDGRSGADMVTWNVYVSQGDDVSSILASIPRWCKGNNLFCTTKSPIIQNMTASLSLLVSVEAHDQEVRAFQKKAVQRKTSCLTARNRRASATNINVGNDWGVQDADPHTDSKLLFGNLPMTKSALFPGVTMFSEQPRKEVIVGWGQLQQTLQISKLTLAEWCRMYCATHDESSSRDIFEYIATAQEHSIKDTRDKLCHMLASVELEDTVWRITTTNRINDLFCDKNIKLMVRKSISGAKQQLRNNFNAIVGCADILNAMKGFVAAVNTHAEPLNESSVCLTDTQRVVLRGGEDHPEHTLMLIETYTMMLMGVDLRRLTSVNYFLLPIIFNRIDMFDRGHVGNGFGVIGEVARALEEFGLARYSSIDSNNIDNISVTLKALANISAFTSIPSSGNMLAHYPDGEGYRVSVALARKPEIMTAAQTRPVLLNGSSKPTVDVMCFSIHLNDEQLLVL